MNRNTVYTDLKIIQIETHKDTDCIAEKVRYFSKGSSFGKEVKISVDGRFFFLLLKLKCCSSFLRCLYEIT